MAEASGNAGLLGIATAVLLYAPKDAAPDLTAIVQFLLDDLRAEGWRVSRLWLSERGAHLVFDGHDLTLALTGPGATAARLDGAMRPAFPAGAIRPDPLRARFLHWLQDAPHGLSVTLRPTASAAHVSELQRLLAARLCLLPILEAAPPVALLWRPRHLILSPEEFQNSAPDLLLADPDPDTALGSDTQTRRCRPEGRVRPVHPRVIRPRPHTRAQRAARSSAGRLFGPPGLRNTNPLPRPDRALARLKTALRSDDPFALPRPDPARPARAYAVAVQWIVLLPYLVGIWLPYP